MNRSPAKRGLCLAFALVCSLTTYGARADDLADEADLQFRLGAERYQAKDYQGALEHFLASNRLVPNKNVLFNIARAYEQLGRAPDAYRYYQQALEGEADQAARRRIESAIERVTPQVAVLRVETDPPGATVYLDRKDLGPRGTTPRALGLPPGRHKIIVEKGGYEPAEPQTVDVRAGQETRISVKLTAVLGNLVIAGEPKGALVRLDDDVAGPSCEQPCSLAVPPGRHTLYLSKEGFQPSETVVDVPMRAAVTVKPKLSPIMGGLVVNADVRDALIAIDDKPSGFTPAVLSVPVGRHKVRIYISGFRPYEAEVEVSATKQARLDAQLTQADEVVAASRFSQSVEDAPASVTIITREELRAMGYPTIAEAVRGVRGMFLSDDRSYVSVGVRGFARPGDYGNRILVLLDGRPMNDNYIWSSYWGFDARVDLDDVERIEVVRGAGSVLYGTSAFFGVVNVVTRSKGAPSHGEVAVGASGEGTLRGRGTVVLQLGRDAGMWMTVSGAKSSGRDWYFPELVADPQDPNAERGANGLPIDGNARNVDGFTAGMVQGRLWYKAFSLQWFLNGRSKTLPTGEYGAVFGDPRNRFVDTRGFFEARFEPQLSEAVQLYSRAFLDAYNFEGDNVYLPADGGISKDRYRGRWGGVEARFVLTPTRALRITAGGEFVSHFKTEQTGIDDNGPYLFDDQGNGGRNDPFVVGAGYVLADVSASRNLKISAGARLDYFSNLPSFDPGAQTNPRLALVWKPYAAGNVKVLAGKAFRAPSVYELHYTSATQVPPVDLHPEQVYSGELEYSHRFSTSVVGTVAGFANYVRDLVELRDLGDGTNQYKNATSPVLVTGGEVEIRREWRQGFMAAAQYTLQLPQYLDDPTLRSVSNTPRHLGSVKAAAPILGRALGLMTRLTVEGPRPDRSFTASDPPQEETAPGFIWDIVFSGDVERLNARYNVGLYNAADSRYEAVPSSEFRQRTIVQSGRTFLASIAVSF